MAEIDNWSFGDGRPRGVRNKHSRAIEDFLDGEMENVLQAMVDAAKKGDAAAARIVVGLRRAPARDHALKIKLPIMASPSDATKVATEISQAMLAGKLTPLQADAALSVIERVTKIAENGELAERLEVLEKLALKAAAAGRSDWSSL